MISGSIFLFIQFIGFSSFTLLTVFIFQQNTATIIDKSFIFIFACLTTHLFFLIFFFDDCFFQNIGLYLASSKTLISGSGATDCRWNVEGATGHTWNTAFYTGPPRKSKDPCGAPWNRMEHH